MGSCARLPETILALAGGGPCDDPGGLDRRSHWKMERYQEKMTLPGPRGGLVGSLQRISGVAAREELPEATFEVAPGEQDTATAAQALHPNVRAKTNNRPIIAAARVRLFQLYSIADCKRNRLCIQGDAVLLLDVRNGSMSSIALHQTGNFEAAGQRAHLLFRDLGGAVHGVLNGHRDEIFQDFNIVRIDHAGVDADTAKLARPGDLSPHKAAHRRSDN